jgi:uncharacterized membrane protein YgcG
MLILENDVTGPLLILGCFWLLLALSFHCSQTEQAVENALKLEGSEFKGRQLKITHKRVNQPGFVGAQADTGYRGGGRGAGGFRGGRGGRAPYRGGFRGRGRGGYRGGGGGYHPYY